MFMVPENLEPQWAKNISLLLYLYSIVWLHYKLKTKNDLIDKERIVDQFNGCVCTISVRRLALV